MQCGTEMKYKLGRYVEYTSSHDFELVPYKDLLLLISNNSSFANISITNRDYDSTGDSMRHSYYDHLGFALFQTKTTNGSFLATNLTTHRSLY